MTHRTAAQGGKLKGVERAAVLLLTLGDSYGTEVWSFLDEEEVRIITSAMTQIGTVDADDLTALLEDFATMIPKIAVTGDFETTERLLRKLLPDPQVDQIMDEVRGPAGRSVWQKLSNVQDVLIANYLKNEHPQTAAVVLSRIDAKQVAKVIAHLPEPLAVEIIHRIVHLDEIPKKTIESIEATLRAEFISALGRVAKRDRIGQMAEVFNHFDRALESRMIGGLEDVDEAAAAKIRAQMFTFDGLGELDPAGIQTLIRACDVRLLAEALKGASSMMMSFFLRNMSKRAGKILTEEIAGLGPMRLKRVDEAQQKIVALAKELERKGEITIPQPGTEEVLV